MSGPQGNDFAFAFGEFRKVPFGNRGFRPCDAFHENMNGHDKLEPAEVDENLSVLDGVLGHFIAISRQSLSHVGVPLSCPCATERGDIRVNPENKYNTLIGVIDGLPTDLRRTTRPFRRLNSETIAA